MDYYLGFDIGGTAIKYAIGNPGSELLFNSSIPTPQSGLKDFIAVFHRLIEALMLEYRHLHIRGIGIATPGMIDRSTGLLQGVNPNLPWWVNISPLEVVPELYREMAVCDNDANLMALAEANGLSGRVLGITLGTGIGSGYVQDGIIQHGSRGFAMEIGHICVKNAGLLCNCGLSGCLEAYSSVSAIQKAAALLDPRYRECELGELLQNGRQDARLQEIIKTGREYFCMALATACMLLDPDAIVIGGGGMDAGLYDISELEQGIRARTLPVYQHSIIRKARMGNQAGVRGAILLATRQVER